MGDFRAIRTNHGELLGAAARAEGSATFTMSCRTRTGKPITHLLLISRVIKIEHQSVKLKLSFGRKINSGESTVHNYLTDTSRHAPILQLCGNVVETAYFGSLAIRPVKVVYLNPLYG